MPEKRVGL